MHLHASISDLEAESDYNLYAKHLSSLGYGIPLWQPAPLSDYKRVKVADVGYVRTGQFNRLFNASLPSDDPAQCRGVPANFQPLKLDDVTSERKQVRMPGVLHTRDMRLVGVDFDLETDSAWMERGNSVRFECSSGRGAILATNDVTLREDAVQLGFLETYMAENYESWLEMANITLGRGIKLEDLILVTGCDLTTQSAMTTFDGGSGDFAITFKASYSPAESSSFSTWGEWHTTSSAAVFKNFGLSDLNSETQASSVQESLPGLRATDYPKFNQCVFLRGFRIRKRKSMTPAVTNALTDLGRREESGDTGSSPPLDQSDTADHNKDVGLESIADKQPFVDPLEPHFERIFETTGIQEALAHDNDLNIPYNDDAAPDASGQVNSSPPKITVMNNEVWQIDLTEPSRVSDLNPLSTPGNQSLLPSPSIEPADWTFPPVPAGLKGVTAYFQRAQELKVKNPVIAYWCTYFAAKQVISSTAQNEEIRLFLSEIMSVLEGMKASLGDHDAVLNDGASVKYIKIFALRVFKKADSEDRKQKANRSTAKKYLASATFFELLRLFDQPMETDVEDKIQYAKWKAADIAKAFREGRTPLPGNLHVPSQISSVGSMATPAVSEVLELRQETMSAWSPSPSIALSLAPSPATEGLRSLESSPVAKIDALSAAIPILDSGNDTDEQGSRPPSPTPSLQPTDRAPSPSPPSPCPSPVDPHSGEVGGLPPDDVSDAERVGGFIWNWNSSEAQRVEGPVETNKQEDEWSTLGMQSISRQGSWTLPEDASIIPDGAPASLDISVQLEEPPAVAIIKRVRWSPSVVGGLSSASSSVAASSPPPSPERYAPTLPTVPEAAYSSDSDREGNHLINAKPPSKDPVSVPLPESVASSSESSVSDSDDSDGWAHGVPPVIKKVPSPTSPPSPNSRISTKTSLHPPSFSLTAPSPQFHSRYLAGFSPHPSALPALHPTPRLFPHTLALYSNSSPSPPSDGSASPELEDTQASQAQRHCQSAISALDYEDADSARNEIRAALSKLDD